MGPISEMDMVSGVIWEKIRRVVGALPNNQIKEDKTKTKAIDMMFRAIPWTVTSGKVGSTRDFLFPATRWLFDF